MEQSVLSYHWAITKRCQCAGCILSRIWPGNALGTWTASIDQPYLMHLSSRWNQQQTRDDVKWNLLNHTNANEYIGDVWLPHLSVKSLKLLFYGFENHIFCAIHQVISRGFSDDLTIFPMFKILYILNCVLAFLFVVYSIYSVWFNRFLKFNNYLVKAILKMLYWHPPIKIKSRTDKEMLKTVQNSMALQRWYSWAYTPAECSFHS